jgi:hypothetical protein
VTPPRREVLISGENWKEEIRDCGRVSANENDADRRREGDEVERMKRKEKKRKEKKRKEKKRKEVASFGVFTELVRRAREKCPWPNG